MYSDPRIASPQDAKTLAAIDRRVSVSPWTQGQFEPACTGADEAQMTSLVLEDNGLVVGFVVFSRVLDEASILNIAVDTGSQGKGLGRELLCCALEQMRLGGIVRCLLEVRRSNSAARGLYEAYDFRLDGVRKNYYPGDDGREDALLMSLQL